MKEYTINLTWNELGTLIHSMHCYETYLFAETIKGNISEETFHCTEEKLIEIGKKIGDVVGVNPFEE